ncbi:MAG: M61 family metallopeptidase [Bryobacteraceae bacterium]
MPHRTFHSLLLLVLCAVSALAQADGPITLFVDLTDAPRKILHARLVIPVQPGRLTLLYPKWIPGEHGPTGPIDDLAGIIFTANGQTLPWRRDDVDMFALHLTVPPGATMLDCNLDFLATAQPAGFSAGASTSVNLAILSWNEVLLYPIGKPASDIRFEASIKIPGEWKLATALKQASNEGTTTRFHPVALNTLVDSPVLAGKFLKQIPLEPDVTPRHYLDLAADAPEDLNIGDARLAAFSNLIRETGALYRSRHYDSYHFLVTLSDQVAHFGLEHHESSDDRVDARTFLDDDLNLLAGSLLPHEFTHSWNGKYRRPAGLVTSDYQQPMKGELLWVYEGLTEYLGDVLAVRSGIWSPEQYRSYLAESGAELDHRPGRTWRNLQDTAIAAQILYSASSQWDNWRRSVDYYSEGELIWLDVDVTMRKLSGGKKSLNEFCARFFGGGNTSPKVTPYVFDDVVSNLNAIQPYDWAHFLNERVISKGPHAPLGGISNGGYRIEYTDQTNEFIRAAESKERGVNAWYSLGMVVGAESTIADVLVGSPAYKAGLGPGMKLVAINGRRASDDLVRQAIRESKGSTQALELIVDHDGFFKVFKIDYHDGERYPHLSRVTSGRAFLNDILTPMIARATPSKAASGRAEDSFTGELR